MGRGGRDNYAKVILGQKMLQNIWDRLKEPHANLQMGQVEAHAL